MNCSTCQHWGQLDWGDGSVGYITHTDDGEMEWHEIQHGRWGVCRLIPGPTYEPLRDVPAYASDGSMYAARLNCRDDFGCVLHAPKEGS